jgi:type I restriction enzyme, S subunit
MASEWPVVRLGEVVDFVTGFPFESQQYTDDPAAPRLLRGDNVAQGGLRWDGAKRWPATETADLGAYWLRAGDVILAMDRPWIEAGLKYAAVRDSDLPALLVQRVARLRGTANLNTAFLKYVIGGRAFTEYVTGVQTGTAVPHISGGQIREFEFALPPLPQQHAIAHILGTIDDKIELNRGMNETLEAIARAVFKSWFVEFDPVRAKLEGRDPRLPPRLAEYFPDSFEDSEVGEIPAGWNVARLGDKATTLIGGTPARDNPSFWGGDIPWINSGKANEFRVVEPSELITSAGLASSATKVLPARTTIIAITGATLGQVSLLEVEACANQSIVGVLGSEALPSEYVYCWVKERVGDLVAAQTGGAQQHINKNDVNMLPVLCPSEGVIEAYTTVARPIFDRIRAACLQGLALQAARDELLPKLVSGAIRVDAARLSGDTT